MLEQFLRIFSYVSELTRPDFPPEEASLLTLHPMAPGSLHVCVALYEYKDLEHSSEAWCAPGFRVDVLEMTNEDWHKVPGLG